MGVSESAVTTNVENVSIVTLNAGQFFPAFSVLVFQFPSFSNHFHTHRLCPKAAQSNVFFPPAVLNIRRGSNLFAKDSADSCMFGFNRKLVLQLYTEITRKRRYYILVDHKQKKNFVLIETRAGITILLCDREVKSNRFICFGWLAECPFYLFEDEA